MQNTNFRVHGELKNTNLVMDNTFWLGLYPGLIIKHLEFTINILKNFFK
jgi:CDP-6-deoxy-D-xylo-4-hexulose-3-dehydrase